MRTILVSVLVIVQVFVSSAFAQPLADRIPADALIYVGWRGIDSMGPGYEQSHLKAVLEASGPDSIFDQLIPQLIERLAEEDEEAAGYVQLVADAARLMWRHPTVLYVGNPELRGEMEPLPRIGIICQAGADARPLAAKLNELLEQQGVPIPIEIKQHGDRLVLSIGDTQALNKLADDRGAVASLAGDPAFKRALTQVHGVPAAIVYVNLEAVFDLVNRILVQVNPMAAMFWPQISNTLGVESLQHAVWTAGFEGKDWGQRLFVAAPEPRFGLMAIMASDPVTDDVFKVVPKTAAMASVSRADLSGFADQIRASLEALNPEYATQFDQGKQQLTDMLGFDPDADLLGALGPQWAVYTDRHVAGTGALGLVVVNQPRDPESVERALARLGQLATALVAEQIPEQTITIAIRQTRADGMTIHYLGTPLIAPAWGVKDGNLYIGLYPQVVSAAASFVSSGAPDLLANPDFNALRRRLGDVRPNSISFLDVPQMAPEGYQTTMMMIRTYTGFADLIGTASPPMLLPPLPKLVPHMSPSGGVTWVDEQGYHMHSISSFPGSSAMATQNNAAVAQLGMMASMVGVMLPAVGAARSTAQKMQSSTQARGIHQGCIFYAQGHDGRFPDDIGTLLLNSYFTVEYTLSPMSGKSAPPGFNSWDDADKRRWVNENTSYVLVPGLRETNDSEKIVLFTKLQDSGGKRISICWNDNHVMLETIPRAKQLILEQTGKSLEDMERPSRRARRAQSAAGGTAVASVVRLTVIGGESTPMNLIVLAVVLVVVLSIATSGLCAQADDWADYPEPTRQVLANCAPLKYPRGDRLPLLLWPVHGGVVEDDALQERIIRDLDARGLAMIATWNPGNKEQTLTNSLRIARIQQKLGLKVCVNANACMYGFFNGDESTAYIDADGKPYFDPSIPGGKIGCPFRIDHRYAEMTEQIDYFVRGYKQAGVPLDFVFGDWEIDGPLDVNGAWQAARKCTVTRGQLPGVDDFVVFQEAVRRKRAEATRTCYTEPILSRYPEALVGNYAVYPHNGERYWFDYFEQFVDEVPHRLDQRAPYRRWYQGEFALSGYTFAMPVCYTWARTFDWYDFDSSDYRWFYNLLLVASNAAAHTSREVPIISFVHWQTVFVPGEPEERIRQLSEQGYREFLWHALLRGHDTFFLWCPADQAARESVLLHAVWSESLEFADWLERGVPISFDVPTEQGPVVSGLRIGDRVLVRRTDFDDAQPGPLDLTIDGKTLSVPRGPGRCQSIDLR